MTVKAEDYYIIHLNSLYKDKLETLVNFDNYKSRLTFYFDNPIVLNDGTNPEAFDEFMVESDFWISYFDDKVYSILVTNGGQIYFGNQFEFVDLLPVRLKMKFDSQISYQKPLGNPKM